MINDDLRTFTCTSDKPYDRHEYRIVLKSGKSVVTDDYEMVRAMQFQWNKNIDHIDILDKKKERKGGKGF